MDVCVAIKVLHNRGVSIRKIVEQLKISRKYSKKLRKYGTSGLDAINEEFYPKAREYREKGLGYIDYLAELVSNQISRRVERSISYRLSKASFPVIKTVEEFDFKFQETCQESCV